MDGGRCHHDGKYWTVSFPTLRPGLTRSPHPPLVRACITEESLVEMAAIGRPALIGIHSVDTLRHKLQLYKDTMLQAGFAEEAVENALDQTWAQRGLYLADSDNEALEVAANALKRYREHLLDARVKFNPGGVPPRPAGQPPSPGEMVEHAFLAGTPETVASQIHELQQAGVRNLLLNFNVGQIPHPQVERSMRLFGEKVMPQFRG